MSHQPARMLQPQTALRPVLVQQVLLSERRARRFGDKNSDQYARGRAKRTSVVQALNTKLSETVQEHAVSSPTLDGVLVLPRREL